MNLEESFALGELAPVLLLQVIGSTSHLLAAVNCIVDQTLHTVGNALVVSAQKINEKTVKKIARYSYCIYMC